MKLEESEMAIPHLFRCPISLDLLKDPVTLSTGQTYERSSIQQWLSSGNRTCPVTMQLLADPTLVPNHTLRNLIARSTRTGPVSFPELSRCLGNRATATEALETLQALAEDPLAAPGLARFGFVPPLLEFVLDRPGDAKLAAQATSCVVKLIPFSGSEWLTRFDFGRFASAFEDGDGPGRVNLCRVVSAGSGELCAWVGRERGFLARVAEFAGRGSADGVEALWAVSRVGLAREGLVGSGAVDGLISYVDSGPGGRGRGLATSALEKLLGLESAREALIRNPGGLTGLVRRVFEVSGQEGSEGAVGSLIAVCSGSVRVREEVIRVGVLTQLLLLLQSQCSGRTKTKARMLLKLLRSKEE